MLSKWSSQDNPEWVRVDTCITGNWICIFPVMSSWKHPLSTLPVGPLTVLDASKGFLQNRILANLLEEHPCIFHSMGLRDVQRWCATLCLAARLAEDSATWCWHGGFTQVAGSAPRPHLPRLASRVEAPSTKQLNFYSLVVIFLHIMLTAH